MNTQTPEKKSYKVILILLVGLAAYSSAIRDLNNLKETVASVYEFTNSWIDTGLITANAKHVSAEETSCTTSALLTQGSAPEFRWKGRVAPGSSVEIKGINGDISAEPASGAEVEVVANRKAARSDPNSVNLKVVEHPGGVTICAVYPSDDPDNPNTCEPGGGGRMNVRNNDVQVDFLVRVPAGVTFDGRTVNGEIKANSLGGNVVSHTVNGAIQISTTGYAEAKTVNGEISAKIGDANWPDSLEFKTVNGEIVLDLPATINTEIKADTFNGEISTDFPLSLLGKMSRKHLSGRIGSGGRELVLKTLNGSIRLRRAS